MNFNWSNWIVIFLVGQNTIPYIFDVEFYDTGMLENLTRKVELQ